MAQAFAAVAQVGMGKLDELESAEDQKKTAKMTAKQLKERAISVEGAGQREAKAERKSGELLKSKAITEMAAGGGGVDSELLGDIGAQADYNALAALYESDVKASSLRDEAALGKYKAKLAKRRVYGGPAGQAFAAFGGK